MTRLYLVESAGNTCNGSVYLDIDGVTQAGRVALHSGAHFLANYSTFTITSLNAGSHTIKLQARLTAIHAGAPSMTVDSVRFSYIILGT